MKRLLLAIVFLSATLLAEDDSLWGCILEQSSLIAPTQATYGDYRLIDYTGSYEGRFLYIPPQKTYFSAGDSVFTRDFFSLKDPWFEWWIERNPLRNSDLHKTEFALDSLSFRIYNHISLDADFPCVRMAYDRGSCEPFSALFYWPESAGHGFPGADAIYYEFYITDQLSLAPVKRLFLGRKGQIVEELYFDNIKSARDMPPDSLIAKRLLSREKF